MTQILLFNLINVLTCLHLLLQNVTKLHDRTLTASMTQDTEV